MMITLLFVMLIAATVAAIVTKNIVELVVGGTLILLNKFNKNIELSEDNLDNWTYIVMIVMAIIGLIIAVI